MALHRLAALEIAVPGPGHEATRAFYRDFGLCEVAPGRFATLDGGEQLRLSIGPHRALRALVVGVDDADDLARADAALGALGLMAARDDDALRAADPTTGIVVTLAIEPRRVQKPTPPLETNGPGRTSRENARSPAAVATDPQRPRRLSHVVTTSTDAAATRRFFVEGLGFRVSDEIASLGAAFLRCSTDHHNLLVQPGPVSFLHHTAWEMDDVDAVGRAAAAMVERDPARHCWGLGRHGIGSNYFWYLRDPSGGFAEYTSDLDVIVDQDAWRVSASISADGLAAWGPPVPREFLAPPDIVSRIRGQG